MPWFPGTAPHLGQTLSWSWGLLPLLVWSVVWKGLALWHAARRGETGWFIAFLFINTVGILEIVYTLFVVKIWSRTEVREEPDATSGKSAPSNRRSRTTR